MVFAPLRGRRAKRKPPPGERVCLVAGCSTTIASWKWLCDSCFACLPYPRKKEICEARAARAHHRVFDHAQAGAAWLADHRAKLAE